jgi:hypothetical protein
MILKRFFAMKEEIRLQLLLTKKKRYEELRKGDLESARHDEFDLHRHY